MMKRRILCASVPLCVVAVMIVATSGVLAQAPPAQGARQGGPPPTPRSAAQIDLTGQWVSVVSEDWRWRMVTPPKGDYASVPITAAARKIADSWDLAADNAAGNQCRAFGAAAIMRQPTRLRISWQDDTTLKIETDAGTQTRLFQFAAPGGAAATATSVAAPERTWQGTSAAQWFRQQQSRPFGGGGRGAAMGGSLRVVTRNMRPGYLRKNGVPYSENAVVTEDFRRHDEPDGSAWFTVTTIVEDPAYLNQPFITSTSFKREAGQAGWAPTPCQTDAPMAPPVPPPAGRGGGRGGL
jgi:hypothetical protein